MYTSTTVSLLTSLVLVSSVDFASAAPPGRHAPPSIAGKLGSTKRSWFSWGASDSKKVARAEDEDYYGTKFGLHPPRSEVADESYYGYKFGLVSL